MPSCSRRRSRSRRNPRALPSAGEENPMQIPFYYDYACPWAYLGSCRVEAYFQDLGATIDFRPVNLAALREPEAGPQTLGSMGERKKTNYMNDMRHWSEMIGADFGP